MRCYHRTTIMDDDDEGSVRKRFRFMYFALNGSMYSVLTLLYIIDYFESFENVFEGVAIKTNGSILILKFFSKLIQFSFFSRSCCFVYGYFNVFNVGFCFFGLWVSFLATIEVHKTHDTNKIENSMLKFSLKKKTKLL